MNNNKIKFYFVFAIAGRIIYILFFIALMFLLIDAHLSNKVDFFPAIVLGYIIGGVAAYGWFGLFED